MDNAAATRVVPAVTSAPLNTHLPRPHAPLCLVTSDDAMSHQRRLERHSAPASTVAAQLAPTEIRRRCQYPFVVVFFYRATLCASARFMPSSCVGVLCVCASHTRYCIKTAKYRITQTTPHDSQPWDYCFLLSKISAKFQQDHSHWGRAPNAGGVG